ncbi:MAG: guanylate kinase [Oscillospiraceae bacterium]|jgi:guanylate kinase|nr:guanylate kinase [Oscillospiraceae bacterium]
MTTEQGGKKGNLFVISAPSGTGKTTIIDALLKERPELVFSISATTREPRPLEHHGVEYYFIDRDEFERMIADGEFLEHAQYVGNLYGTPRKPIEAHMDAGRDVVLDIEVQGAKQVRESAPNAKLIFIAPPNLDELERRLRNRSETDKLDEETIQERLNAGAAEIRESDFYDITVTNDEVDRTVREILNIMDNNKLTGDNLL